MQDKAPVDGHIEFDNIKSNKFLVMTSRCRGGKVWIIRASTSIVLWTCMVQLVVLGHIWGPRVFKSWPACFTFAASGVSSGSGSGSPSPLATGGGLDPVTSETEAKDLLPPKRLYKSNGYLMVSCNGGLNQMRAAICDMVTIARFLNVTLVVPELDKASFWADPSEFKDIFDVDHFITSLRGEVRIVKELPSKLKAKAENGVVFTMPPVSWSNMSYYLHQILPLIRKHKVLHLIKTDARLANNGMPLELQKLRCRVNYNSLVFNSKIGELGQKLLKMLQQNGPFVALHLRYEMDMLAFSGCTHGCTDEEAKELTRLRHAYPWWKEKVINSDIKRKDGLCPLTPEETALVLKAFDFDSNIRIYIAAGEIYGGERRMAALYSAFPNIVRKETLLSPMDLKPFQNHSSQMAALDYMVSLASDVFIPTYDGNMAKVMEGHRRFLGFRQTILLDRIHLVELIDQYNNGLLRWEEFSLAVKTAHVDRIGGPMPRLAIPDKPKDEEYFYANPQECLQQIFDGKLHSI